MTTRGECDVREGSVGEERERREGMYSLSLGRLWVLRGTEGEEGGEGEGWDFEEGRFNLLRFLKTGEGL